MIRVELALALALAPGLAACTTTSQVGPYVKSVARNGAWLAVTKCWIVLEGDELSEGPCTLDHVPIGMVPAAPPPGAPGAQPLVPPAGARPGTPPLGAARPGAQPTAAPFPAPRPIAR